MSYAYDKIKKILGACIILFESQIKIQKYFFSFFYGSENSNQVFGRTFYFYEFFKYHFKNPGLLGFLTGFSSTLVACVLDYLIHKMRANTNRYPILATSAIFCLSAIYFPIYILRSLLAGCATLLLEIFVLNPYKLYQYFNILKSNKEIMIVSHKPSSDPVNPTRTVEVPEGKFELTAGPFTQKNPVSLDAISYMNLNLTVNEDKSITVYGVTITDTEEKEIGFIPMYSSESKIYLSRLLYCGIIQQSNRYYMPFSNMFVKNEPVFYDERMRWANESDDSEKNNNANINYQYYLIALSSLVYNLPIEIVPIIAQYIHGDSAVHLSSAFNEFPEYKPCIQKNAHFFFVNKAQKTLQYTDKNVETDPAKLKKVKTVLSKFYKIDRHLQNPNLELSQTNLEVNSLGQL